MARIGLLTGGGDCPGLNAVIRAVVRKGINTYGHEFVGFRYGWAGVLEGAYAAHPERFVRKPPRPPKLPTASWINPPDDTEEAAQ